MSDNYLHLKPTHKDTEPTQLVVGFRPHLISTQLGTQMANPTVNPGRLQTLLGAILPLGLTLHSI